MLKARLIAAWALKAGITPVFLLCLLQTEVSAETADVAVEQQPGAQEAVPEKNWNDVQSVLNRRCVVCHSCYDAPCQLKLTSPSGILRGASKQAVYHTERLHDAQPTRLGIDAQTLPEWRALGFFSVTSAMGEQALSPGLIESYLNLRHQNPLPQGKPLPAELGLALDRPLICPSTEEFASFSKSQPLSGMPYGTAPLEPDEFKTLVDWARGGAAVPSLSPEIPEEIKEQIAMWEHFLNADDPRIQLMSRYIYEHLFLARLHFQQDNPRRFFQIVRSVSPPGEPIETIATRRPFDDPGQRPFYYRLEPVSEAIVQKEHLVYELGPERMARYEELFLAPDWTVSELPAYGDAEGGNPFSTFTELPARARYQFLLDDALFFVRSFIRGPVCHGETAVDVIEDRFWVSFLDPASDLSVTDPSFLRDGAEYLELPVSRADGGGLADLHGFSHRNQVKYLEFRDTRYQSSALHQTGFGYNAIWDGNGTNPNALITVFRHFDNASAMTGFHGDIPETAWVIDYPVFERIYYNLVAGYDVFGRVEHQLATRLYMDELRMESEDNFLNVMPGSLRPQLHDEWYRGVLAELHTYWHERRVDDSFPTGITFASTKPKEEFLTTLLSRGEGLWPLEDPINRCPDTTCSQIDDKSVTSKLRDLAGKTGDWVKFLPDLSILAVEPDNGSTELFTLVHDKAHYNIAFLFDEQARREPEADVLTILPGLIGSYPNFFFKVQQENLSSFTKDLTSLRTQADYMEFVNRYGVRRTSTEFWPLSDRIAEAFFSQDPVQAGILDLNRYKDPKAGDAPD